MPGHRLPAMPLRIEPARSFRRQATAGKWTLPVLLRVGLLVALIVVAALWLRGIYAADFESADTSLWPWLTLGGLSLWRFAWWASHLVRAKIYERRVYPDIAARAAGAWDAGWRPPHIHVLITTYRENRPTAEAVVRAIAAEVRCIGQPATIWLGSRDGSDELLFARHLQLVAADLDIHLRIIRQAQPGKRVAIGLILRAMARTGIGPDDLVAFMDSDFILSPGCLARTLPLFATDPDLHAVTTDEDVETIGPRWVATWLSMRFAQRRLAMASHALSGRVLTLTGRFSVFRARHITTESFIRLLEADHLDHWLWGRFRFLSGDDKSTWFGLLQQNARMLYVPDAHGVTVEVIEGTGVPRMIANLKRWSGNMLRNGARAIALGPRRMPLFIWWCIVDQRIAMWTMLLGPTIACLGALLHGPSVLLAYGLYVIASRLLIALVLASYSARVDLNYVWCLYANQLLNASIKLYMIWHLPQQSWVNRGNQTSGVGHGLLQTMRSSFAFYLTLLSVGCLVALALIAAKQLA
jgi:mannuronan synthase